MRPNGVIMATPALDGQSVATEKMPHTLPFILRWDENLDIGCWRSATRALFAGNRRMASAPASNEDGPARSRAISTLCICTCLVV